MFSCSAYSSCQFSQAFQDVQVGTVMHILSRVVCVWHLVVVVCVNRVPHLGRSRCDLSSRLKVVARRTYPPRHHLGAFFLTFLHLSHFPAFPPRDTLHGARSQNSHLSIDPKSRTLGRPSPGYPIVLSSSIAVAPPRFRSFVGDPLMGPSSDLFSSAFIVSSHSFNTA